jgi:hypothetical protein
MQGACLVQQQAQAVLAQLQQDDVGARAPDELRDLLAGLARDVRDAEHIHARAPACLGAGGIMT